MRLIRENMFLAVLVGVVIVVGGVMFAVGGSLSGGVDEQLGQRTAVAETLASLAVAPPVNTPILNARTAAALRAKKIDDALGEDHLDWNAGRFDVLHLPVYNAEGKLLLAETDVTDWPGLLKAMRGDPSLPPPVKRMGAKLWETLPADLQKKMPPAGQEFTDEQKKALLAGLNQAIQIPDFFRREEFFQGDNYDLPGLTFPPAAIRIVEKRKLLAAQSLRRKEKLSDVEVQRLNRLVLAAFLPGSFASPDLPAFPIDTDKYQKHTLRFHFVQQYHQTIQGMLNRLKPTRMPSEQEILIEVKTWDDIIQKYRTRQAQIADKKRQPGGPGVPVGPGDPRFSPDMGPGAEGMGGRFPGGYDLGRMGLLGRGRGTGAGTGTGTGAGGESGELQLDAKLIGDLTARMRKAEEGNVYADMENLGLVFPVGTTDTRPPDDALWRAQVHLWVVGDILEAIGKTNEQALGALPQTIKPKFRSVLRAPIKQIVDIEVVGFESRDATVSTGTPRRTRTDGLEWHDPDAGRSGGLRPAEVSGTTTTVASLTQRKSSPELDLVRYNMVLLMTTARLVDLQRNLLSLNYHVITNVRMQPVPDSAGKYYYYGPEPLMMVRIEGELPLLSAWTRGKWDKKNRKWLVWNRNRQPGPEGQPAPRWVPGEPLMPVKVLQLIQQADPTAIRPDDLQRMPRVAPTPGMYGRPS